MPPDQDKARCRVRAPASGAGGARGVALARAHAALVAGCDFMVRHRAAVRPPTELAALASRRTTANRLRELDRFLSLLMDEIARSPRACGPAGRSVLLPGTMPGKLRRIEALIGVPSRDASRLRSIGRVQVRLRQDPGWRGRYGRRPALIAADATRDGGPSPAALRSIGRFYRAVGDRLLRAMH